MNARFKVLTLLTQTRAGSIESQPAGSYVPDDTSTQKRNTMAWSTPRVTEACVGMEVTSYESAE